MSQIWGQHIRRCVSYAVAACALLAITGSSPTHAGPIPPIPDGLQTMQLITIPTVVGATFSLNGVLTTTGPDGLATLQLSEARDLSNVTLVDTGSGLSNGTAQFVRLSRAPNKDGALRAYALFKISRDVSFTFRDSIGNKIPVDRVTSLTVKSSIGESFTLTGDVLKQPLRLPSERSVAFVNGESAMKEIYYSVQEVIISGSNTVFRSQQKFFPIKTSLFEVETVFYTLTVKTSDALFGFSTGSNIVIKWPDQHISTVPIRNGQAVFPALPRGEYEADWVSIEVGESRNGKPRIVLSFEVIDDDVLCQKLWLDLYLTPAAMARTKRELAKLGITFLGQPMGRALHAKPRSAYDNWKQTKDDKSLAAAVAEMADVFGKERKVTSPLQRLRQEDMELI